MTIFSIPGAISEEKRFLSRNEVSVFTASGKKIDIGKPDFKTRETDGKIDELVFYEIERETLMKIAADKAPSVRIGKYQRVLDKSILEVINRLLEMTE